MNPFESVFDKAYRDGIIVFDSSESVPEKTRRSILLSIHNSAFNNWLIKKFQVELNSENYPGFCTDALFSEYLKDHYKEKKLQKVEVLAQRIERKMEVGLLPGVEDALPDVDELAKDVNYYAKNFEPHHTLFLAVLKRGGINSIRDYIHTIFSEVSSGFDMEAILASIMDMGSFPNTEEEIAELAQRTFANKPPQFSAESHARMDQMVDKMGTLTEEEKNAESVMMTLVYKLLINRMVVVDANLLRKSFLKAFLEQYIKELSSLMNSEVPAPIIEALRNVRAPNFETALKQYMSEMNYSLPVQTPAVIETKSLPHQQITATSVTIHNAPVATTNNNTVNGSGTINSGKMKNVVKADGAKENWWWKTLKQWWWAVVIPVAIGLFLLYCEKKNWVDWV